MKHKDKDDFEGKDLEEAIHAAAKSLGIPEPELHYEVLQQGRKGLLGLGTKNVRIRVMRPVEHLTDAQIMSGEEPARARMAEPKAEAAPAAAGDEATAGEGAAKGRPKRPSRPGRRRRPAGARPARAAGAEQGEASDRAGGSEVAGGSEKAAAEGGAPRSGRSGRGRRSGRGQRPRRPPAESDAAFDDAEAEAAEAPPAEPVEPLTGQALEVQQTLEKIIEMSGLDLEVQPGAAEQGVALRLSGGDRRMLKQRNAELLLAFQFLLNRMARRTWPEITRIRLTTNGDHKQRESSLIRLTRGAAKQVAKTGRTKMLRPMNAYERRLVHLTIREYSGLTSSSDGSGAMKRVRISKVKNELTV